ncbi:TetR/AcrR family transcriptional regulator [Thalassovita taeanensis]|uniref:Transcriptional regulator, TetR family n=1 Tax=Thalassovita taeanensis TaxID=657014 RepID=A0A1H9EXZ3_9RHOB|nr:TetR/AcrR family transcriptional regulator [Thalassovita taeanensis]SEQ30477.1 transcriptional regulator, TetR family [Thalassovita taeanensis]
MTTDNTGSGNAKAGRPIALSQDARREIILDALDDVFTEAGLKGVSMAAIARQAGMSKRTLYEIFSDRAALFLAYLDRVSCEFVRPLDDEAKTKPLAVRLRLLIAPGPSAQARFELPLAIIRSLIVEAPERPDVARALAQSGYADTQNAVKAELDRGVQRGEIRISDTETAAAMLLDMIRPCAVPALLGETKTLDSAILTARFDLALKVFFGGIEDGDDGALPLGHSDSDIG